MQIMKFKLYIELDIDLKNSKYNYESNVILNAFNILPEFVEFMMDGFLTSS